MVHTLNFYIQDSKLQKESRNYMPARAEQYIKIHKKAFTISINKHTTYFDIRPEIRTEAKSCGLVQIKNDADLCKKLFKNFKIKNVLNRIAQNYNCDEPKLFFESCFNETLQLEKVMFCF